MQNRFGSKGVPIHSPPVDLLSRWLKKSQTEQSQSQPESQTGQPEPDRLARQTDRASQRDRQTQPSQTDRAADRQTEPDPSQTDGRPPGGLGRPARLAVCSINGKEGRVGQSVVRLEARRSGAASGAKRREQVAGAVRGSRTGIH